MVKRVADWAWSSYRAAAGRGRVPRGSIRTGCSAKWVDAPPGTAYERFVQEGLVRNSPWNRLQGQIWLGDEAFLKRMQRLAAGKAPANVPRSQRGTRRARTPTR